MKTLKQFKEEQLGKKYEYDIVTHCKIEGPYLVALVKEGQWWFMLHIERRDGEIDTELSESFENGEFTKCGVTYQDCIDGLYEAGFMRDDYLEKFEESLRGQLKIANTAIYRFLPTGWRVNRLATTAPEGYVWIDNGKSRFCGSYQHALMPISVLQDEESAESKEEEVESIKVKDSTGREIDYASVVMLMDDGLREEVASTGEFDGNAQGFADAYAELHKERFGEDFAPMCGGEW